MALFNNVITDAMNNEEPGTPGPVEATAALIVFVCLLGSMWLLLFKAAIVLLKAFALI